MALPAPLGPDCARLQPRRDCVVLFTACQYHWHWHQLARAGSSWARCRTNAPNARETSPRNLRQARRRARRPSASARRARARHPRQLCERQCKPDGPLRGRPLGPTSPKAPGPIKKRKGIVRPDEQLRGGPLGPTSKCSGGSDPNKRPTESLSAPMQPLQARAPPLAPPIARSPRGAMARARQDQ